MNQPRKRGEKSASRAPEVYAEFLAQVGDDAGRQRGARAVIAKGQHHHGFNSVHTKQGNFYSVYVIPAEQVQSTLAMGDNVTRKPFVNQIVEGAILF